MLTTPKKNLKNITDAPDVDAKTVAGNDATDDPNTDDNDSGSTDSKTSPYSLINRNRAPNAYDDDSASPDSLIDSKLKPKIDPRSIIKIKKKSVTDVDAVDDNASHDTMNTAPYAPNHIWELPVIRYHEIMVIYPNPFFVVITLMFSETRFINYCICIFTGSPG